VSALACSAHLWYLSTLVQASFISEAMPPAIFIPRTYMLADYLSNYIQHPTQKMDYGALNALIGREVDQAWYNPRDWSG
jgi:hypothetical protein